MDKTTPPLPTAPELITAIHLLSQTLHSLRLKHALVSHSAIFLHAKNFTLPCLLPSSITILIQPSPALSAHSLIQTLQNSEYSTTFLIKHENVIAYPNVILKRPKDDIRGDLLVKFEIVDHWTYPQRREAYDLHLPGNETQSLMLLNSQAQTQTQVQVMSPSWLLRQKMQTYNSRSIVQEKEKHLDEIDIRTLVDILGFSLRGGEKMRFKGNKEVEELRKVVKGMRCDDPLVLGSVVECPEVFGPWWKVGLVRGLGAVVGALVLMKLLGLLGTCYDG